MNLVIRRLLMRVFAAFVLIAVAFLTGCDTCANEAPAEHLSPDGRWKYVSFDRNCGATTGSNLQVSILPASTPLPNEGANAFIADNNHVLSFSRIEADEIVEVGRPADDQPGWLWCRATDAREGWMPVEYLSEARPRAAVLRDYSAKELSVEAGNRVEVAEVYHDWARCSR